MPYRSAILTLCLALAASVARAGEPSCAQGFAQVGEEQKALEAEAQKILDRYAGGEAERKLTPEQIGRLYKINSDIQDIEAEIAKKTENRALDGVPTRYVYRIEKPAAKPRGWNRQLDTIIRQHKARIEYDPLANGLAGRGGATDAAGISLGHFENYASGKELDDVLQHEGIHLRLDRALAKGVPTAFDANFKAEGDHTLAAGLYAKEFSKQEEATFRNQTKTLVRLARDSATVKQAFGEEKVPLNISRLLQSQNVTNIAPDGKIVGDFPILRDYRETTAASLRELTAVQKHLAATGAHSYTLELVDDTPAVLFRIKDAQGRLTGTTTVYLPEALAQVKNGNWRQDAKNIEPLVKKQVERLLYGSRLLNDEAMAITKEVDPALYARITAGAPSVEAVNTAAPAKTPLSKDELRELEELTRKHAEAVKKAMELLGNREGRVVRVRAGALD